MKEEFPQNTPLNTTRKGFEELPEDHWFNVISRIKEKFGADMPSPMEIRAGVILELAGIPSGQYSALQTDEEGKRTDTEGDRSIAEHLTNPAGLMLSGTKGITTRDPRDRYPGGLPEEVLSHLDEKTQRIIGVMYEYDNYARENFSHIWQHAKTEKPLNLHFLPGGIPLVLVGYQHEENWQKIYGRYMKEIGKEASMVAVEGGANASLGASLDVRWEIDSSSNDGGHYDVLMKDLVESGFSGMFTEVDGRDISHVDLEHLGFFGFLNLPESFYEKYLAYLKRENPKFGAHVGTKKRLKKFIAAQHTLGDVNFFGDTHHSTSKDQAGKEYYSHPSLSDDGKVSLTLTGNELGQMIYTDALATIKLHLIGKMMNGGYIPKGPIVDYEGAHHLPSKSFFLQYPEYAMEIVLRTIPELLAGTAEKLETNDKSAVLHAKKVFDHTDWEQVIKEIFEIPFRKVSGKYMQNTHPNDYVLDTILASQKEGEQDVGAWVRKMEELMEKFAI